MERIFRVLAFIVAFGSAPHLSATTIPKSIRGVQDQRKADIISFLKARLPDAYVATIMNDPRFAPDTTRFGGPRGPRKPHSYSYVFTEWSRARGAELLQTHADVFQRAEEQFGVPRSVIAAIFAIETQFGSYAGRNQVIIALYTRALLHPRKEKRAWARNELRSFLAICYANGWDPFSIKGSPTGAFGYVQFEPSSYEQAATRCDGADGPVDLWSELDAICSAANYLRRAGWTSTNRMSARRAIWHYNHEWAYVDAVLRYANIMAPRVDP